MFAVCWWLGNSPTVAKQHYLHLTDLDFDRATGIDQPASRGKMRATAGQKAGQQGAARRRITTHLELANIKKALQTQSFCIEDGTIGTLTILTQVPPRGVELLRYFSGYSANSSELSADVSADSLNPEQLAAQLRDLDRSELEQLLLTLLSQAESASE